MSYHFLKRKKYIENVNLKETGNFLVPLYISVLSYQVPVILTFIKFKFIKGSTQAFNVVQEKIMLHVKQSLMLVLQETCLPTKENLADCWFGKKY